ncbi:MAG TPA: hypothetical protein VF997_25240 [Polyangia bacterium]
MSDERNRRDDWARLLEAWPAPTPRPGFAARVLAACELPPPVELALVPFALHRRHPPANTANVVTLGNSFDLGPEHD